MGSLQASISPPSAGWGGAASGKGGGGAGAHTGSAGAGQKGGVRGGRLTCVLAKIQFVQKLLSAMRRGEFLVDRHGRTTWRMLFKFVLVLCASFFMHKYVMEPLGRVTDLFNIDCSAQMEGSDGSRVDVGAPRADSKTLDPITALPIPRDGLHRAAMDTSAELNGGEFP